MVKQQQHPLMEKIKKMKDIVIYGFGGLGREIATLLISINKITPTWNLIGYIDDGYEIGTENKYGRVLGNADFLNNYKEPLAVIIAIATPSIIQKISDKLTNNNLYFPNIIAPDVLCFDKDSLKMGKGNLITYGCRLSCNITLGNFNLLNGCVSLGHDVIMGDFNTMFPDVRVSGETVIGNSNFFGARTFVAQRLKIGEKTRFAAGSIVLCKTRSNSLYMGNPARKIEI